MYVWLLKCTTLQRCIWSIYFFVVLFTGIRCYAVNYELALSFIFQTLRFAELTVNMSHVNWFAGVYRQPDTLFYYACVNIYINLSEVF